MMVYKRFKSSTLKVPSCKIHGSIYHTRWLIRTPTLSSLRIHCCLFDLALPSTPRAQFLLSVIFAWPLFSPPLLCPSRGVCLLLLSPAPSPESRLASASPPPSLIRDERSQAPEVRVSHTHVQEQRLIERDFLLF